MTSSKAAQYKYTDIQVEIKDGIGVIKLNRPTALNAFNERLVIDLVVAFRELNDDTSTIFTVLTGEGRFFSAGADVKAFAAGFGDEEGGESQHNAEKKIALLSKSANVVELMRSMIDHRKLLVLAFNGPAIGGASAWFQGFADTVLAADTAYIQIPFSELGLVPENGSAIAFAQQIGVQRANDVLFFGRRLEAQEMLEWGLISRIFPAKDFIQYTLNFLQEQLEISDGVSLMESKRLQNQPLRDSRLLALHNSVDAVLERFVAGAPIEAFRRKLRIMEKRQKL